VLVIKEDYVWVNRERRQYELESCSDCIQMESINKGGQQERGEEEMVLN
jgi:hypothetical protein